MNDTDLITLEKVVLLQQLETNKPPEIVIISTLLHMKTRLIIYIYLYRLNYVLCHYFVREIVHCHVVVD